MKKIVVTAHQRFLREKFHLWRQNVESRAAKEQATERLVIKVDRRLKRLAFKKYLDKITDLIKEEVSDKRIGEIKNRL